MCQLERWLCCVCEDAYVAINFFCNDVPPGAPACPASTRCERHIASRYCYFCANVDHRGSPLLSRTPEFLESLASLEGMIRVSARTDRDDVALSVFSSWLMGFHGPTTIHPFDSQHPALTSQSTRDHFTRYLSPPQIVPSFHVTSSERFPINATSHQPANLVDMTNQPYLQFPTQIPSPFPVNDQFRGRANRRIRHRQNRKARRDVQSDQEVSSSPWSISSRLSSEGVLHSSWGQGNDVTPSDAMQDADEQNEGLFPIPSTLDGPIVVRIPKVEPDDVNHPVIVFGSMTFSLPSNIGSDENEQEKKTVSDQYPEPKKPATDDSLPQAITTTHPQRPSVGQIEGQEEQNDRNSTSEESKDSPPKKNKKSRKQRLKEAKKRRQEEKQLPRLEQGAKLKPLSEESQPKSKPKPEPEPKPEPKPESKPESKSKPNSKPKRKSRQQLQFQPMPKSELAPVPAPKLEQKSEQMPVHHQIRVPTLSYRDALSSSTGSKALPNTSS
ncbi:uncharacterized protein F4812DRAFT_365283 [Daldinia caldariorum]|uniref:uncharacterized protein n=1 Tax=Daldinia caldariorum TaxID=326644 RepID=UPI0020077ED5|nr:uncharacterized protein F4812DRAFT_365283 [Daldinia caldariorum]KAI1468394.1 hypothetical protein F4812DRAFT_365283 [Daldinia caldariorum]